MQSSKWLGRLGRYGPLVLWIGVIFYFSSGFGSFNQTSRFIRPLLEFLFPGASPELLTVYHGFVRKFAHFAAYAVLGVLAMRAYFSSVCGRWKVVSVAFVVCLSVALADEFTQSFNPARTGTIYDVALDMIGAATAILVVHFLRPRTKFSTN